MSSGPSPSSKFRFFVNFERVDGTDRFQIRTVLDNGGYTISDKADSPSDDTTQLGDVANESFNSVAANGSSYNPDMTYFGHMTKNPGVVARFPNKLGKFSYLLYTNSAYTAGSYVTTSDISQTPFALCFASGTRILTARGAVPVEELAAGDQAVTASGAHRPVVWTGHRHVDGGGETLGADQSPVRVRADAFGPGRPARDLRLSPGHPVLVGADADGQGGVLVPIMCLVNGTSIAREPAASVTYWHVELDAHDILLAEGLPAESFLDFGCRAFFEEASDHALHNPDFVPPGLSGRCRPVVVEGPVVEAERARLDALFALGLTDQCGWSADGAFAQVA